MNDNGWEKPTASHRHPVYCSMRTIGLLIVAGFLLSCLGGGSRPSEEVCEKACLHFAKLFHDDKWSSKLAAAPESERAAIEKERVADWQDVTSNPERGLQACVVACNRPGRQGQVDCHMKATTWAEAQKCDE